MLSQEILLWLKKVKYKVVFGFVILECLIFSYGLANCIRQLYSYNQATGKRFLTNKLAIDPGRLIVDTGVLNLLYLMVLILIAIPAVFFYQYYMSSKSIYTVLRLPKKHARVRFYLDQIIISIKGLLTFWAMQLLLLLVFYGMYSVFVPEKNIPPNLWSKLWATKEINQIYPFTKPLLLIPVLAMSALLPSMTMLFALAERSRKQCVFAAMGLVIGMAAIYYVAITSIISLVIVPIVTLMSIGIGIYYVCRVQIV